MASKPSTLAAVDGWPINVVDIDHAVAEVRARIKSATGFTLFTLNVDHLVKLRQLEAFRASYAKADLVTADGAPVAFLGSRQGHSIQRTTGADLVVPLAKMSAEEKSPIYLFGTNTPTLESAAKQLMQVTNEQLDIVALDAPEYGFDPEGEEADAVLERIRASGARLCFVALGAPKQEIFARRAMEQGVPAGFICVGAALDFLSAPHTRAPKFMQNSGMEWLWRLARAPGRLTLRYAQCAIVLADVALRSVLSRPLARNQ